MKSVPLAKAENRPAWVPAELDWSLVEWDQERHPERPAIVLGGYRRASTYGQKDGARFQETLNGLRRIARSQDYGLVYFDEGTRSAKNIYGRKKMPQLLDYLRWGLIQGILAPDIKRLTRDHTMQDGLEIAEVLQDRRGILVTGRPRRVWDLTNPDDFVDYRREVFDAGEDWLEIRTMFWGGMNDRVEQIQRGDWPPFFRCPTGFGYLPAVCYERTPGAVDGRGHWGRERWTTDPAAGARPLSSRGHVARTWVKDPSMAETFATLREVMLTQPNTGEVLREIRERGIPCPWKSKGETIDTWLVNALYRVLRSPIYSGRWQWVTKRGDTVLWRFYDPSQALEVPELGYWSAAEHELFRRKFLESYSPRRRSSLAHPFAGLAACPNCHTPLSPSGKNPRIAGLTGQLFCPNRKACPKPVYLAEDGVRRALDALFPTMLAELPVRREQLRAELRRAAEDPALAQLEHIKRRQAGIVALIDSPEDVTPELKAEQKALAEERRRIEERRASAPTSPTETELVAIEALLDGEPEAAYAEMDVAEKASLWRLLLQCRDDECGHAKMDGTPIEGLHVTPVVVVQTRKGSRAGPGEYRALIDVQEIVDRSEVWMSLHSAVCSRIVA